MDNPNAVPAEDSIDVSNEKQTKKRRSAAFTRQSIVPADQESINTTEEISQESKKIKLHNENKLKSFDIKEYIESLKQEDKKWRETYAKRKSRVQELKRDRNQESLQSLDISLLSDSERAFLAAKPDYEEFNRNLTQLRVMATKVAFLNKCAEHFNEGSSSKIQSDTNKAVNKIIDLID